jgi:hypothetical protein
MDEATARDLVSFLEHALQAAAEAQLELTAFETALKAHNPGLVEKWKAEAESLRKQKACDFNVEALNALKTRLSRQ